MLTEQERMNNALKELLFFEERMAKKYEDLSKQINDPKLHQMFLGMEMASRNNYGTLSKKMNNLGIV